MLTSQDIKTSPYSLHELTTLASNLPSILINSLSVIICLCDCLLFVIVSVSILQDIIRGYFVSSGDNYYLCLQMDFEDHCWNMLSWHCLTKGPDYGIGRWWIAVIKIVNFDSRAFKNSLQRFQYLNGVLVNNET